MPPSPAPRRSLSSDNFQKRVNSFGNALSAKPKDDELTLFTDMQKIERESFLLEPSEDFNESISKLSNFPDVKLGINVPARGESHDLLNVDGDKNDYEWLLTPPETPLFRSLDDEEDQSVGKASRGRAQSKPIQISRSSTMDNNQRSSRSSASPSRLSPSPRSMTRTRPSSSASRSSPPLSLQPLTPSRRPSTPPVAKTSTPPRRSPSPASRRMSTGSSGPTLNGTRGPSPVKSNRRSSSPKLQGWQSNVPGFSYDAPPNLRTSLPDRSVSRSRGGSPSSFSGLDVSSRGRRQSTSPTPSRRASSSHSIERDRSSSYSKASATSSGEDDLDSMQSVLIGYSSSPALKKSLAVMKTRTIASSRKPSKSFSPSTAPKRSFDSAVWLMDHRKVPQDMFRPLLSSVPATTFGSGKANNVHRPMFSHSSSMATRHNANTGLDSTFGPYMESDQEQHDLIGEWEADNGCQVHEDIFMLDKLDEVSEEASCEKSTKYVENDRHNFCMKISGNQISYESAKSSQVGYGDMATCSRCGKLFNVMDMYEKSDFCEECDSKAGNFYDPVIQTLEDAQQHDDKITNLKTCIASGHLGGPDFVDYGKEASLGHQLLNNDLLPDCTKKCPPIQLVVDTVNEMLQQQDTRNHVEKMRPHHVSDSLLENTNDVSFKQSSTSDYQQTELTSVMHDHSGDKMDSCNHGLAHCLSESDRQHNEAVSETDSGDNSHQLGSATYPSPNVVNTEGTGISVLLLQKSNSNTWPVMEGRTVSATNILCSEPYYTRDNVNMMKRSFGWDSSSAASSIDIGSSRQSDPRFERLRSGKRGDFEKAQLSSTMSRQSIASASDMSISGSSASFCLQSDAIGDTGMRVDTYESSTSRTIISTEEHDWSCKDALSSAMIECSAVLQPIVDDDNLVDMNSSFDRLSEAEGGEIIQNHSMNRMADNDHLSTNMCFSDSEMRSEVQESSVPEESCMPKTEGDTSAITQCCLIDTLENPNDENNFDNLRMQLEEAQALNEENKLDDCCVSAISEEDALVTGAETSIMELPNDEQLPEAVEGSRIHIQRCFTLEEATDTILFCSSIVHDLAYKAATIALEHEQEAELTESTRPTVTIIGKSIAKEDGLLKLPHRRTPNRKVKRKRLEGETTITETAGKEEVAKDPSPVRSASGITRTSDSMKPPKLESKCNCVIM